MRQRALFPTAARPSHAHRLPRPRRNPAIRLRAFIDEGIVVLIHPIAQLGR
jgi:hypothetical protein